MTSPPSSQPMSACSWVTPVSGSGYLGTDRAPASGPVPVTTVPAASISATAATTASEISRTSRPDQRPGRPGALLAPDVQRHRRRDQRRRGQVVHRDPARVELGQHDDAADDRLGHDARGWAAASQTRSRRRPPAVRPVPPGGHEDQHGDHEDGVGHQPVAELDPPVDQRVAVVAAGHQAVRRALRASPGSPARTG